MQEFSTMETEEGRFVVVQGSDRVLWPDYDTREAADAAAARMNRHGEV